MSSIFENEKNEKFNYHKITYKRKIKYSFRQIEIFNYDKQFYSENRLKSFDSRTNTKILSINLQNY